MVSEEQVVPVQVALQPVETAEQVDEQEVVWPALQVVLHWDAVDMAVQVEDDWVEVCLEDSWLELSSFPLPLLWLLVPVSSSSTWRQELIGMQ